MVQITVPAEIRRDFVDERISLPARSKNGQLVAASEFRKRYYNAEVNGEACILRCDEKYNVPLDLHRGELVEVDIYSMDVESDVTNFRVSAIRRKETVKK